MGVQLDGSIGVGVSRLEVIGGPSGRRRRTKAERARIAAESMMPGVTVADTARKHGTTRWQIYDWRKQIRKGNLVVPESVAALPFFAELVVDDSATEASAAVPGSDLEIVVGDIVIRAGPGVDEGQLTRAIRAAGAINCTEFMIRRTVPSLKIQITGCRPLDHPQSMPPSMTASVRLRPRHSAVRGPRTLLW